MSNQTSEWNRSQSNSTNDTNDEHIKIVDSEHFYNLHHGDQRVAESIVGGNDLSSQAQDFPLPREAATISKNEQESRGADLPTAGGVGDLLNTKLSSSMNSETNSERSYAFVTGFPLPQETAKAADDGPTSTGVSDLLHHTNDAEHNKEQQEHLDPIIPPHLERSFANVAGKNNIPSSASSSTNNDVGKDEKEEDKGGDTSSSAEEFPLPQEASTTFNNEPKNRGVDLSATGVGDLLNKKSSPSMKLETNTERSYAFVTDFPPPQETAKGADDGPKSMGVGDLLHHANDIKHNKTHLGSTTLSHPEQSFANVAGNNNIPSSPPSPRGNDVSSDEKEEDKGGDSSSSTKEFPLPQEASTTFNNEPKNRGVDLSATGVGDLLNKNSSPSMKLETNAERSYAFVTDFPPPQKTSKEAHDTPKSMGVGDLLHHTNDVDHNKEQQEHLDPTIPPHPQRSFANVAGNKDFPSLSPSSTNNSVSTASEEQRSTESLSNIPDVKDMLGSTSVKVKPPPSSHSFAKMASKPPPSDDKSSPRTIALEKQNQALKSQSDSTTDPSAVTHENFPTLAQSNQMFEQGVSVNDKKEKAMFTEISKISDAAEAAVVTVDSAKEGLDVSKKNKGQEETTSSSFANITSNNLDKAPPSASSRPVPSHPEYDEQTMMNEAMKREERKSKQADAHEDIVTPEQVLLQERTDEINTQKRNEAMIVSKCIERFDKSRQGKFTMLDTFKTLCGMGYSFISAIPMTVLMHLRLSPLTSPYPFPFLYRSITDWFTLPIYTNKIVPALAYGSRSLLTGKRGAFLVNRYGRQQHGTNNIGLSFWDGIRGMNKEERLGWWQLSSWAVHRLQWMVVYTILQDPKSHLVTADALSGLPSYSTSL